MQVYDSYKTTSVKRTGKVQITGYRNGMAYLADQRQTEDEAVRVIAVMESWQQRFRPSASDGEIDPFFWYDEGEISREEMEIVYPAHMANRS